MSNNHTVGMDTNKINEYVYAFRSALRKYLKKGVSIKTVSYPFDSGAVNVINYSFCIGVLRDYGSSENL